MSRPTNLYVCNERQYFFVSETNDINYWEYSGDFKVDDNGISLQIDMVDDNLVGGIPCIRYSSMDEMIADLLTLTESNRWFDNG